MDVTELAPHLFADAVTLWHQCGLTRPWNDPVEDLRRAMRGPDSTVLACLREGELLATAMVGHDGHRGWVYYLAVLESERQFGVGRTLMTACEEWVVRRGIPKLQLMVRRGNEPVLSFYARLGYEENEVVVLGRRLDAFAVTPPVPTVPPDLDRDVLLKFCLQKLDALTSIVGSLDDDAVNWRPKRPGTNSIVAVLAHCCGTTRRWSSTVNLGVAVPRNRDAEFAARMSVADALHLATTTRAAFLGDVQATRLDDAPVAVPPERVDFWTGTCRGVLLHVLEELSQHLGQAEIIRDDWLHRSGSARDHGVQPRPSCGV